MPVTTGSSRNETGGMRIPDYIDEILEIAC